MASTVKNFTIRNQNASGEWETLYPKTVAAQVITTDAAKFVTAEQIANWNNKATKDLATTTTAGLMSAADKVAINALSGDLKGIEDQLKAYADAKVAALVDSAPEALDTLSELAAAIQDHQNEYDALLTVVGAKATKDYVDAELAKKAVATDVTTALSKKVDTTTLTTELAKKANASDVTTKLALKADITSMNSALALKVDATALTTELAKKVDTTTLTTELSKKVDTTTLTTELAKKADASDVTTKLALKADAATVTTELNKKVDTTTFNTELAKKTTQTQVDSTVKTAVSALSVTSVGTTAPTSAKAGDFWFEVTA